MGELSGIAIGVTAERRAGDFIGALERYGADVRHAPTITIVPLAADPSLRAGTEAVLAEPVAFTVVTTGAGFRGWLEAAEGWGLRDSLVTALERSRIYARGPKAVGAVRGAGLREAFSAASESNAELFGAVAAAAGVGGSRVAVQLHGTQLPEHTEPLVRAGARLVEVQPYRWHSPPDVTPVHGLIDAVLAGELDALAFTSAPAAANFLTLARAYGRYDSLVTALRGRLVVACVGPVTAAPLEEAGVETVQPDRQRLGALVKLLVTRLGKG